MLSIKNISFVGVICLLIAIFFYIDKLRKNRNEIRRADTNTALTTITHVYSIYLADHGRPVFSSKDFGLISKYFDSLHLPSESQHVIGDWFTRCQDFGEEFKDAWGNNLLLFEDDGCLYLTSSGEDQVFDSDDDVSVFWGAAE